MRKLFLVFFPLFLFFSKQKPNYDTIIHNATIYDGTGGVPYTADIGIIADTIAFIGDLKRAAAKNDIDAQGMALAPGFIDTDEATVSEPHKISEGIVVVWVNGKQVFREKKPDCIPAPSSNVNNQ